MTRGMLRDTCQSLVGACGEPSGSTDPGMILAKKPVLSDLCAAKHISKTGWGAVIRVKIVFLTLKISPVCHFTGIFDVTGLREAQRVFPIIVLLRKTARVQVLLRNVIVVIAEENSFVDVIANFHMLFKRVLSLTTQR